jgi:hypothetical protein
MSPPLRLGRVDKEREGVTIATNVEIEHEITTSERKVPAADGERRKRMEQERILTSGWPKAANCSRWVRVSNSPIQFLRSRGLSSEDRHQRNPLWSPRTRVIPLISRSEPAANRLFLTNRRYFAPSP